MGPDASGAMPRTHRRLRCAMARGGGAAGPASAAVDRIESRRGFLHFIPLGALRVLPRWSWLVAAANLPHMSTDQPSPSAGNSPPPPQPPNTRQSLRSFWRVLVELWWRFFDWLAVVSWKTLLLVYLLLIIPAAVFNKPHL